MSSFEAFAKELLPAGSKSQELINNKLKGKSLALETVPRKRSTSDERKRGPEEKLVGERGVRFGGRQCSTAT